MYRQLTCLINIEFIDCIKISGYFDVKNFCVKIFRVKIVRNFDTISHYIKNSDNFDVKIFRVKIVRNFSRQNCQKFWCNLNVNCIKNSDDFDVKIYHVKIFRVKIVRNFDTIWQFCSIYLALFTVGSFYCWLISLWLFLLLALFTWLFLLWIFLLGYFYMEPSNQ